MVLFMESLNTEKDEVLAALCAEGNGEAEEILVERYTSLVRACARPLFLVGGDSEDLIQEGMVGLMSAVRHYRPDSGASFRTYAERCIKNRMLSAVRSAGRLKHRVLSDSVPIEADMEGGFFAPDPEELLITKESFEEMNSAMESELSALEKKVLKYYLEGMSYSDISERVGRPVKSVDNAVQRIRKKVARLLN